MTQPCLLVLVACTVSVLPTPSWAIILGRTLTGACAKTCEYDYEPLCANDGFTYPNFCTYSIESCKNSSLAIVNNRPCTLPDPCLYVCPRGSDPVCGNNGLTYPNPCVLMFNACFYASQGIRMRHKGACVLDQNRRIRPPCPKFCTRIYEPVCGSDGRTYANSCRLESVTCRDPFVVKEKDGVCDQEVPPPPTPPRCPLGCTREYLPVCASDGRTYNNMCLLNMTACKDPTVFVVSAGPCAGTPEEGQTVPRSPQCPQGCTREYLPVCASDGRTYNNMCLFDMAACKDPSLKVVFEGRCDGGALFDLFPLTRVRKHSRLPQKSGTSDLWWFREILSLRNVNNSTQPTADEESDSCNEICPFDYNPVCGNDGITYSNECTLQLAICRDPSIKPALLGPC